MRSFATTLMTNTNHVFDAAASDSKRIEDSSALKRETVHSNQTRLWRSSLRRGWLSDPRRATVATRGEKRGTEGRSLAARRCAKYCAAPVVWARSGEVGRVQAPLLRGIGCEAQNLG